MSETAFTVTSEEAPAIFSKLYFDAPPSLEFLQRIVQGVGEQARDSNKVEVPIKELLQGEFAEENWWKGSSVQGVTVPMGPKGAFDTQEFSLGKGMAHHGLIIGRPNSGKTNLMHVLITMIALCYPPEEVELYLIDFKQGVGFKSYAARTLPHARVIAIESEREFGISVLEGLAEEKERRGVLFRQAGQENIAGYRAANPGEHLPRVVLIADEYQAFFAQDDALRRKAEQLLDDLVRQGRSYGIHIILGTQTLQGSAALPRATKDQVTIRIALPCSEADARDIFVEGNTEAKFLSRIGEAIYNPEGGAVEANSKFQVALFNDEARDTYLDQIRERFPHARRPIVFEGSESASLSNSQDYEALLKRDKVNPKKGVGGWLGEPIALKPPTAARFRRQGGSNLAIVTNDEKEGIGVLMAVLTTLIVQHNPDDAIFFIADYTKSDEDYSNTLEVFNGKVPQEFEYLSRRNVPRQIEALLERMNRRIEQDSAGENIYFVIAGLQRARELRKDEDDYSNDSVSDKLMKLLREGPDVGIHTIVLADSPTSVTRTLGRRAITEFGLRAAGKMSIEDSQAFLDDGIAGRLDRQNRMVFADDEKPGMYEKFRPFGLSSTEWLSMNLKQL